MMNNQDRTEQWQAMFQVLPMFAGTMQKNANEFWKTQGSILDGMQDFAEGWFQRRHVGVQAAHEACKRMCGANTPIEWFHEYQMWIGGAFQRLMADSLVLQHGLKKITDKVSPTLVPTINREQGDVTEVADKGRVHMT
jgi:hypothetical protein